MPASPPTYSCKCGRGTIPASHMGEPLLVDAEPTPDGAFVLTGSAKTGAVTARHFDPVVDAARRRWMPHVCPAEVFAAIDFETAEGPRDSACQLGIARVEGDKVVAVKSWLVRPPRATFSNSHVHHITYAMVQHEPTLATVWREHALPLISGSSFLVAHNKSFDAQVLKASLQGDPLPELPWICTLKLVRKRWPQALHRLTDICAMLEIPFDGDHHDAGSDALAAAKLLLHVKNLAAADWDARRYLES